MDNRSWMSGGHGSAPSAPVSPSAGYPTDGNPGVTPPTNPGAYWFHQVGEELRTVIAAGGVTPDASTLTQLLAALNVLFQITGASPASSATNSIEFPNGTILKWGTVAVPSGGNTGTQAFTFAAAFPNAVHRMWGCPDKAASGGWNPVHVHFPAALRSASGATMVADTGNNAVTLQSGINVEWFALGY